MENNTEKWLYWMILENYILSDHLTACRWKGCTILYLDHYCLWAIIVGPFTIEWPKEANMGPEDHLSYTSWCYLWARFLFYRQWPIITNYLKLFRAIFWPEFCFLDYWPIIITYLIYLSATFGPAFLLGQWPIIIIYLTLFRAICWARSIFLSLAHYYHLTHMCWSHLGQSIFKLICSGPCQRFKIGVITDLAS
jgi:hypothetical protein